ncbi:DUF2867 domain-containing protein [Tardiphaga sp.]|uniref:DUF2867 domain-containing protein n=1 Tax=Tardiphaga sp. TaxID=1926292 RepID=UPI00260ECF8D|nr:DUF2867 domain-containing protein [Tardiphaga sp.]MDB5617500.1 hypothetical protein [Tardiphaga sp.]
MNIAMVRPEIDPDSLLAGAQFIDAFSVTVEGAALDARTAADRMLGRSPGWVQALLAARDFLVKPFGLTTTKAAKQSSADRIGMFPVISDTPHRIVAGFNDSHLDFRVVVDVAAAGRGQRVTATTVVLTHNLLGRAYLTIITPFHRLIVRTMLRQVAG